MLIPTWLAEGSACFPKLKARFSRGASWNSPEAEIEVELNYPTGDVAGLLIPKNPLSLRRHLYSALTGQMPRGKLR